MPSKATQPIETGEENMSIPAQESLRNLAETDAADAVAEVGESALAAALRRAREDDTEPSSQHHSYNSHSSHPW